MQIGGSARFMRLRIAVERDGVCVISSASSKCSRQALPDDSGAGRPVRVTLILGMTTVWPVFRRYRYLLGR